LLIKTRYFTFAIFIYFFEQVLLDAFEKIENYLEEGSQALERGDLARVGELMNAQMEQENRIGAATARLNELCVAALKGGALGAKLMGAGGGGCMVALCSKDKQDSVCAAMKDAGGIPYPLSVHYDQ
jgi:mevalonate kinase